VIGKGEKEKFLKKEKGRGRGGQVDAHLPLLGRDRRTWGREGKGDPLV